MLVLEKLVLVTGNWLIQNYKWIYIKSVFYRFCRQTFNSNYKATIGVDFEVERFEILGVPFILQM